MVTPMDWSQFILLVIMCGISFLGGMLAMWSKYWEEEDDEDVREKQKKRRK